VIAYMIVVRPAGILTVTYQRRVESPSVSASVSPPSSGDVAARLEALTDLRAAA